MYVKLNEIQPQLEEWIKKTWKEGRWSPNVIINSDGEIIDSRLRGGLRPSPVTRDLLWGVPVPATGDEVIDAEMKDKVLCKYYFTVAKSSNDTVDNRCLGTLYFSILPMNC